MVESEAMKPADVASMPTTEALPPPPDIFDQMKATFRNMQDPAERLRFVDNLIDGWRQDHTHKLEVHALSETDFNTGLKNETGAQIEFQKLARIIKYDKAVETGNENPAINIIGVGLDIVGMGKFNQGPIGHKGVDELILRPLGEVMQRVTKPTATLARTGGDELLFFDRAREREGTSLEEESEMARDRVTQRILGAYYEKIMAVPGSPIDSMSLRARGGILHEGPWQPNVTFKDMLDNIDPKLDIKDTKTDLQADIRLPNDAVRYTVIRPDFEDRDLTKGLITFVIRDNKTTQIFRFEEPDDLYTFLQSRPVAEHDKDHFDPHHRPPKPTEGVLKYESYATKDMLDNFKLLKDAKPLAAAPQIPSDTLEKIATHLPMAA